MKDANNASSHPIPGFELVRNEENGFYYFQCKDINGKPILHSKDFQPQNVAENKLQNAVKLARQVKNYIRKKDGEQHYFILVGGNKKEIARSVLFKNEKDLQRTMDYLKQVANSAKAISASTAEAIEPPIKNTIIPEEKPIVETRTPAPPKKEVQAPVKPKYSFKIDLYPREEENTFSGRIEYLLSEESAIFQGIDGQAIAQFIKKNLPELSKPSEVEKVERKTITPPVIEQAELFLLSESSGRPVRAIESGQPQLYFCLRFKNIIDRPGTQVNARISINSITGRTLNNFENKLKLSADKTATLMLPGSYFSSGMYRIKVNSTIISDISTNNVMESSCLFQVF
ncbi:MAG: hypothetical protein SFU99_08185 [Saprospiraceae bacterium]|nr:hypothetical protein [Saprospiraceae bacterium]